MKHVKFVGAGLEDTNLSERPHDVQSEVIHKLHCHYCFTHFLFSSSPGAPGPPGEPFISRYGTALTLHWTSGDPGRAPITRYVIEARPSGESNRQKVLGSNLTVDSV